MDIFGGEMKKRNTLRALGALVIFAVVGLLSACESFQQYEPEGTGIELLDMGDNDEDYSFIIVKVIKSSKLPICDIEWTPSVTATDNGRIFGQNGTDKGTGTIRSTTTLIFTGPANDINKLVISLYVGDSIYTYPPDTAPEELEEG